MKYIFTLIVAVFATVSKAQSFQIINNSINIIDSSYNVKYINSNWIEIKNSNFIIVKPINVLNSKKVGIKVRTLDSPIYIADLPQYKIVEYKKNYSYFCFFPLK